MVIKRYVLRRVTKEVIITRISKNRQHNGQKKKNKRTNNDLQNITHKTKDRITQTSVKPVDNMSSGCKSDL